MTSPPDAPDDSQRATAEEEEELRRMRKLILDRSDRRWWQLVSRKTLMRAFWLFLLLLAILWLQRNTGRMAGTYNETFAPAPTQPGAAAPLKNEPGQPHPQGQK